MPADRFLLDTNIVSALLRDPQGSIARKIEGVGEDAICTSIIVAAELRFGAKKRGLEELTRRVNAVLNALTILPFISPADDIYAASRAYLEEKGTPIGPNDLLIAASAIAQNCILVTKNTREFSRVPGLAIVDWSG
ncbi:MAG: type II toxin-antitoxin system VapC family toxin [Betaproteobacteria bacterium]|nr:type II toxin-antitoxin system VapC family toxin [Betaproteobacteria bacterium]